MNRDLSSELLESLLFVSSLSGWNRPSHYQLANRKFEISKPQACRSANRRVEESLMLTQIRGVPKPPELIWANCKQVGLLLHFTQKRWSSVESTIEFRPPTTLRPSILLFHTQNIQQWIGFSGWYCWWKKFQTINYVIIIYRLAGFLPSTVFPFSRRKYSLNFPEL